MLEPPNDNAPDGRALALITEAVATLEARRTRRDSRGRYVTGNASAAVDGLRSDAFVASLVNARNEIASDLRSDFGLGADALQVALHGVELLAELTFRRALGESLRLHGGPTTAGGRARRLIAPYVTLVDREMKARAQLLELVTVERRARKVESPDALVRDDPGGSA